MTAHDVADATTYDETDLTVDDLADLLRVHPRTVRRRVADGSFPHRLVEAYPGARPRVVFAPEHVEAITSVSITDVPATQPHIVAPAQRT